MLAVAGCECSTPTRHAMHLVGFKACSMILSRGPAASALMRSPAMSHCPLDMAQVVIVVGKEDIVGTSEIELTLS